MHYTWLGNGSNGAGVHEVKLDRAIDNIETVFSIQEKLREATKNATTTISNWILLRKEGENGSQSS